MEIAMNYLGEPRQLAEWLKKSAKYQAEGWLYIKNDDGLIVHDTVCWPGVVNSRDLSEEEYDEMEVYLENNGFKLFLSKDQIEDIESNLKQQLNGFTELQLLKAVIYYWDYDAFIEA